MDPDLWQEYLSALRDESASREAETKARRAYEEAQDHVYSASQRLRSAWEAIEQQAMAELADDAAVLA